MTALITSNYLRLQQMAESLIGGEPNASAEEWLASIRQLSTKELERLRDHMAGEVEMSAKKIQANTCELIRQCTSNLQQEQSKVARHMQMRVLLFTRQVEASISEKKRQKVTAMYFQQKEQLAEMQSQILKIQSATQPQKKIHSNLLTQKDRAIGNLQRENLHLRDQLREQKSKVGQLTRQIHDLTTGRQCSQKASDEKVRDSPPSPEANRPKRVRFST